LNDDGVSLGVQIKGAEGAADRIRAAKQKQRRFVGGAMDSLVRASEMKAPWIRRQE